MRLIWQASVAASLAIALAAATALAEDVDAILRKGNDLRRGGRDREALSEFQRAARINETPRVTAQIALAEQALGLWVAAEAHMTKALAAGTDPWIAKNRPILESALGTVRTHIGTVEIWGTPEGAEVLFDGKPAGRLPSVGPLSLVADEVALQVRAPGHLDLNRTLHVRAGALMREHVELRAQASQPTALSRVVAVVPEVAPSPPTPAATNGGGGQLRQGATPPVARRGPWTITTAGLAGAALVFGVVEHVVWQNKVDSFGSLGCDADLLDRGGESCPQLYDSGRRARTLAFIGYGAAGALAATSMILYLARPSATGPVGSSMACAISRAVHVQCAWRF
ncbi:MAG TPA: hypothetical protein VFH68_18420 [Polyangia bacterium]|jgi:hypothetical protein|nr:hypothetical protein [Polyangia bacterium]